MCLLVLTAVILQLGAWRVLSPDGPRGALSPTWGAVGLAEESHDEREAEDECAEVDALLPAAFCVDGAPRSACAHTRPQRQRQGRAAAGAPFKPPRA